MRLVAREYLGMLRESGEFDELLPHLLFAMGLTPISKPQRGVRQAGVDIAAVGPDDEGEQRVWLFILKRGDVGRNEWSGKPQDVRPSLEEAKDVYIPANIPSEHRHLPVRIVVAITGEFKQEAEQNCALYSAQNSSQTLSYSYWNVDKIAALLERHLLNEYCLPGDTRSQLRRALALVGEVDYELEHFYELLDTLLKQAVEEEKNAKKRVTGKAMARAVSTIAFALAILVRWARDDGHTRNGVIASERALLWTWDAIMSAGLNEDRKLLARYLGIADVYLTATAGYLEKIGGHLVVRDALLPYFRESALYTERIFDEIGLLATIGWSHALLGILRQDEALQKNGVVAAEILEEFLQANPCSGSPCFDSHSIEITLGLSLLLSHGRRDGATTWLRELVDRTGFAYAVGKWFPIATDSVDDLVSAATDGASANPNLKLTSWMVPTLAQWAAALSEDEVYWVHAEMSAKNLPETCFQLWYPDNDAKTFMYRRSVRDLGITEAPTPLPSTAEAMREHMQLVRSDTDVGRTEPSAAIRAGIFWLDFIASRHFRTPMDPALWQANTWRPHSEEKTGSDQGTELSEG